MVNKKIVIIVTIIAIIVISGIVYFSLNREFQNQYTFSEQTVENEVENNVENNTFVEENTTKENETKEEENKIEKEDTKEIDENEVSNTNTDVEEDEKENETEKLAGKDKAISLAKKEWGENDNTVYYYVEEQVSDNVYIISVRDQATTQDLSTYKVDINEEFVEKD